MRLAPGQTLLDRYQLAATLGHGASATTYLAHDLLWNANVALKLLRAPSASLLDALRAEFDLLRGLSHPNLTVVHDFATVPRKPRADHRIDPAAERLCFYTCDPVDGVTLEQAAAAHLAPCAGWMTLRTALCDVLHALHWLHALGIRHGDVKPGNVMVRNDGRAVLIDLGCARPMGADPGGLLSGTPDYLAPELLAGRSGDGRSDLFAFGRMLERLRTRLDAPWPDDVAAIATRLVRDKPSERPSSAHEVLEALGAEPARLRLLARSATLVGRDGVMTAMRRSLEALTAHESSNRVLWISGPEGVGKSRVMREIKWLAQQRCRVIEVNSAAPRALYDALARAAKQPEVGDLDGVLRVVDQLAASDEPSVILLDDAQRLHEDQTAALLGMIRGVGPSMPLSVVVSSTHAPPGIDGIDAVELEPLGEGDLRAWLGEGLPTSAVRRLYDITGGYPSSVRSVLDQLERGELEDSKLLDASVPLSERRLAAAASLSTSSKRALGVLVVLDGSLSPSDNQAHGIDEASLLELQSAGFAHRDAAGWKLVRSGEGTRLLDAVGPGVAGAVHLEMVERLETSTDAWPEGERLARLVYHLAEAGETMRAAEILIGNRHQFESAPRSWRRAACAVSGRVREVSVQVASAQLDRLCGDVMRAEGRLATLLEHVDDPAERAAVQLEMGTCAMTLGDVARAVRVLEAARSEAGDASEQAAIAHLLARVWTRSGAYRDAARTCEVALEALPAEAATEVRVDLLQTGAVARSYLGELAGAREWFRAAMPLLDRVDDPRRRVRVLGGRALVEYRAGNLDAAAEGYRAALETADRHGLSDLVVTAALNDGTLCHQRGDWGSAMSSYERGMRLAIALGQRGTEVTLRFNLAKLFADIGLFDRADTAARRCLEIAQDVGQSLMAAAAQTVLGDVAVARKQF
ncbi:MAG: protein kinase domain-containing protein, partial [Myxococcota bacterium]